MIQEKGNTDLNYLSGRYRNEKKSIWETESRSIEQALLFDLEVKAEEEKGDKDFWLAGRQL